MNRHVSAARTREVWAYLSRPGHTNASLSEIADALRIPKSQVWAAFVWLRDCGWIEFEDKTQRTRRLIVPFMAAP